MRGYARWSIDTTRFATNMDGIVDMPTEARCTAPRVIHFSLVGHEKLRLEFWIQAKGQN